MMTIDKRWFVEKIADKGLSQRRLAKLMDLDPSAITHIFSGKRKLQLSEAQQMSRCLGVPVDEVLQEFHDEAVTGASPILWIKP